MTAGPRARLAHDAAAGRPGVTTRHFDDAESAAPFVAGAVGPGDVVLVKGSRGARMERVVRAVLAAAGGAGAAPAAAPDAGGGA